MSLRLAGRWLHTGTMAYDEVLADRIRFLLEGTPGLSEKKMFGGVGFMVHGHMAVAANSRGSLMVRVDPAQGAEWVTGTDVTPMEMRGKTMHGWLFVDSTVLDTDDALQVWLDRGLDHVAGLPPK